MYISDAATEACSAGLSGKEREDGDLMEIENV